jgi:hypothetical protein
VVSLNGVFRSIPRCTLPLSLHQLPCSVYSYMQLWVPLCAYPWLPFLQHLESLHQGVYFFHRHTKRKGNGNNSSVVGKYNSNISILHSNPSSSGNTGRYPIFCLLVWLRTTIGDSKRRSNMKDYRKLQKYLSDTSEMIKLVNASRYIQLFMHWRL